MPLHAELGSIAKDLAAASALTEGNFADIGQKLESSIETLGALTQTFERLHQELEGENVRQAAEDIRGAATRVAGLAAAHGAEKDAVNKMGGLAHTVQGGATAIAGAVKNADLLSVSARIAAANLGEAGGDFSEFAGDIARTLKLARDTLDRFRGELADTVRHLAAARAGQSALDRDQNQAMQSIPDRLSRSIDAIAEGGRRAAAAAVAVQEKSKHVSQRIGSAVMALQIGDKTRQRIEHAEFALGLLREAADRGDAESRTLLALGCRLQTAQLSDAADDFDRQVKEILSALAELGTDAGEILRLGNATYGGGDSARGAFLLDLKDDVSHAHRLLESFRTARNGIDGVITAVSQSGASLVRHIGEVRSLEADIRIMGLNATLKCGRLGDRGRALSVVAHELRVYANQIATEAGTVMSELDRMVAAAGSLADHGGSRGREEIAAVAQTMTDSLQRLGTAGQSLAEALTALQRDSGAVAGVLGEATTRMAVREQIGQALRRAAAELARVAPEAASRADTIAPAHQTMLDKVARTYTMAEERVVHDTVVRGFFEQVAVPPRTAAAPAASANVDDMLF